MGLATDGGLLLPQSIERLDRKAVEHWRGLTFQELFFEIMGRFIDDIEADELRSLINRSYATFTHAEVTPVVSMGGVHILELFHGPTLAFKDVALQFLGNVFEYILGRRGGSMNILGATSGDTGSAAIYGVRGKKGINIFILHPHKLVSAIQELQMTTVTDANVFNIAIKGTFDDGQSIVKTIFNDISFKDRYHLGAVNSINWARILAQVVYYVYGWLRVADESNGTVDFSVPTGNFGDIFAGYIAREMMPEGSIGKLILATNANDLLSRFVLRGDYSLGTVVSTSSPSMDIQVASNFERYLYYLNDCDTERTREAMESFAATGRLSFDQDQQQRARNDFLSRSVSEEETEATIRDFYNDNDYLLDPHTAVGVKAAMSCGEDRPVICLATAHPAKFGDAVTRAIGHPPELPSTLAGLAAKESRCEVLDAKVEVIKDFVVRHAY